MTRLDPQVKASLVARLCAEREAGELTSAAVRRAAVALGVGERSVSRWLRADDLERRPRRDRYEITEADRDGPRLGAAGIGEAPGWGVAGEVGDQALDDVEDERGAGAGAGPAGVAVAGLRVEVEPPPAGQRAELAGAGGPVGVEPDVGGEGGGAAVQGGPVGGDRP